MHLSCKSVRISHTALKTISHTHAIRETYFDVSSAQSHDLDVPLGRVLAGAFRPLTLGCLVPFLTIWSGILVIIIGFVVYVVGKMTKTRMAGWAADLFFRIVTVEGAIVAVVVWFVVTWTSVYGYLIYQTFWKHVERMVRAERGLTDYDDVRIVTTRAWPRFLAKLK